MKSIILSLTGLLMSLTILAQEPMRPPQGPRPLPNQFRDFVDHQQRWNMERPKIEKKDGKVIITMSEEQFKRMQQMRVAQRYRMAHFVQPKCERCEHRKHSSKSVKNRKKTNW